MSNILMFPVRLIVSPIALLIFFVLEYLKAIGKCSNEGCIAFIVMLLLLSWNWYPIFSAFMAVADTIMFIFKGEMALSVWVDD